VALALILIHILQSDTIKDEHTRLVGSQELGRANLWEMWVRIRLLAVGRCHGISRAMEKVLAKELEPFKPLFIEEPVLPEKNEALLEITKHTGSSWQILG
jgi:hypothetical protein